MCRVHQKKAFKTRPQEPVFACGADTVPTENRCSTGPLPEASQREHGFSLEVLSPSHTKESPGRLQVIARPQPRDAELIGQGCPRTPLFKN